MTEPVEGGHVDASGVRIRWLRSGGAKPPLVLAHGFADSGACWASMLRLLAAHWDVVAIDARGHGGSDAPTAGYSGEDQARDLLAVVDTLGLERPVLMGHSMGGETVAWAELLRPSLARALVLEDSDVPFGLGGEPGAHEKLRKGLAAWVASLQRRSLEELVAQVAQSDPRWPVEDRLPWAESKHAVSQNALDGFALTARRDLSERCAEIVCPVLLLKADAGPEERARHREIVARLPAGEIVHVTGAGHNVRRDEPVRTAYELGRFLSRV